jgi:hypothetical protein
MEGLTDGQQHTRLGDPGRVYPRGFQVVRTGMRSEHDTIKLQLDLELGPCIVVWLWCKTSGSLLETCIWNLDVHSWQWSAAYEARLYRTNLILAPDLSYWMYHLALSSTKMMEYVYPWIHMTTSTRHQPVCLKQRNTVSELGRCHSSSFLCNPQSGSFALTKSNTLSNHNRPLVLSGCHLKLWIMGII